MTQDATARTSRISPLAVERALGSLRIGAGAVGLAQTALFPGPYPFPWLEATSYGLGLLLIIVGVVTRVLLRLRPATAPGLAVYGFVFDVTLIVAFVALYSFEVGGGTHLLLLLVPLEGALKFGTKGAVLSTVAVAGVDIARNLAVGFVWGNVPNWNETTFLVGLTAIAGGITGVLSNAVERERAAGAEQAARAERHAEEADRSRRELAALHQVILAGIGEREERALDAMADEIHASLGYDFVAVVLLDDGSSTYQAVMRGGDPDRTATLAPDPGGPVEAVLRGGDAVLAEGPELRGLRSALQDPAAELVAAIRVRGTVIGALVV